MNNLDSLGFILLFVVLILGGGFYLMSKRNIGLQDKIPLREDQRDNFELAEEFFPLIEFPPDAEREHIPDLPLGYDDDRITIMARDPEWIYAYWDISENKRNSLRQAYGPGWDQSLPVLRVYDVTGIDNFDGFNAHNHYDLVINDLAGNWYIHVGVPDRTYCVDLGRILNDGTFVVVARSNYTLTPRNTISDKIDPEWMLVSENENKLFARIGRPEGFSSGELFNRH